MKLKVTFLLLFLSFITYGQIDDSNFRLKVLRKNIIGKEFTFGKWNEKGDTETNLTYLGNVKTKKGKIYKIMNSVWNWGISGRATSRILIFNDKNQYIGNYYVTTSSDLPIKLDNGFLIFKNTDSDCDKKVMTKVNFKNGLPKSFYRKCNNEFGDIYNFES
ncbi:hypothetical protein M9Q43_13910 [Flavobacterium sp. HXWNR29]|uniref:hypothetical protein n=1 Tax=Flavobacterium odoriferum TaxID=2946604 RepID=UPI0021CB6F48|nr:hypothetical protein [Flavobacterium sp. HXWNR29]MCU4190255.1 hypothetical protein [Flavobacterium sp. HXWNR29]